MLVRRIKLTPVKQKNKSVNPFFSIVAQFDAGILVFRNCKYWTR